MTQLNGLSAHQALRRETVSDTLVLTLSLPLHRLLADLLLQESHRCVAEYPSLCGPFRVFGVSAPPGDESSVAVEDPTDDPCSLRPPRS